MVAIQLFHLSLLLLLCFLHCCAQTQSPNNAVIELGSTIVAGSNDFWRSSSGEFAFGFKKIAEGRYIAGVVFDKIPERTVVWSANRDDPAQAGSTISLSTTGELWLTHANKTPVSVSNVKEGRSALMSDDGNLMLLDASSNPIWQSFDHPTDTLLPGQVVKLRLGSKALSL